MKKNNNTKVWQVHLINLGCAKNLVESEMMAGLLAVFHYNMTPNPAEADIIIINTCAFIEDAKRETINTILQMAQYKAVGSCRLLLAVGCMGAKYREEMLSALPELDEVIGNNYADLADLIAQKLLMPTPDKVALPDDLYLLRRLATKPYTAYLKLAEGCDNHCSYCLIPQLKGFLVSRPMDEVLKEAARLRQIGVKELNLVAQDLTRYGEDICGRSLLPQLIDQLAQMDFTWIRLLYLYPTRIDDELLQVMARHANICRYLDIPLQHIDGDILRAMNRQGDSSSITAVINKIYAYLPDAALRTTFIVGFPGEDKAKYASLLDFIKQGLFTWVGVFTYSKEAETKAATLSHQCDRATKQRRRDKAMQALADISAAKMRHFVGGEYLVLVEGSADDFSADNKLWYKGRSQYQAPEVDGNVYFTATKPLTEGDFVTVKITQSDVYDLIGEVK